MELTNQIIVEQESNLDSAARLLLRFAGNHRIICFFGEMGSGKTTFIKMICRELDVIDTMSSPTFSIVNEYITRSHENVYHFDFYRIISQSEAIDIGIEEYFNSGSYSLIEWPEKILNLLPKPIVKVNIGVEGEKRLITFSYE